MTKVCVITGGGSGMGLEAAKLIKDRHIVLSGRTEAKLQKAVRCIHRRSNRSQRSQNGACRGYSFRKFRRRRR